MWKCGVNSLLLRKCRGSLEVTRRSVCVNWVACGTCYTKTEGTDLGGIELQRSSNFF